jgi:plastocyanin
MTSHRAIRKYRMGTILGALACAVGALAMVTLSGGPASADSVGVSVSYSGLSSSAGSGDSITVSAGDSVTFVRGGIPTRYDGPATLQGWYIVLNTSNLPGSGSSVTLSSKSSYAVTFNDPGSYAISWIGWTGSPGAPLSVKRQPQSGETTSATITVTGSDTGGGSGSDPTSPGNDPTTPPDSGNGSGPGTGAGSPGSSGTGSGGAGASGSSGASGSGTGSKSGTTPAGGGGPITFATGSAGNPVPVNGFAPPTDTRRLVTSVVTPANGGPPITSVRTETIPASALPPAPSQPAADRVTHSAPRPTGLAIASIAVLAIVMSVYAHRYLGRRAH